MVRNDLAAWALPLVADRIREFYALLSGRSGPDITVLANLHRLFWRALLEDDLRQLVQIHLQHVEHATRLGIAPHRLSEVDTIILDELMDVITARFHGSPTTARDYGIMLLRTTAILTEARLHQAA